MTGIERIAAERKRQIAEGWTEGYEVKWLHGEFVKAAICYLYPSAKKIVTWQRKFWPWNTEFAPWDSRWWKPSLNNHILDLEKAGALIAAEIDRLLRLEDKKKVVG